MEGLGRLLPMRFLVLAKNPAQARDFLERIQRSPLQGVYVDSPDKVRGLRDPVVVQIGNYFEHPNFVEISHALDTRGRLTNVTVTDWR